MYITKNLLNIHTELMFIIFKYMDMSSLRNLLKISNFKLYFEEIKKYIQKYEKKNIEYWNQNYYEFLKPTIENNIARTLMRLYLYSDNWSDNMLNCVNDCLVFDKHNLNNIKNKENIDKIIVYNQKASYFLCEYNSGLYYDKHEMLCKNDDYYYRSNFDEIVKNWYNKLPIILQ